MLYLKRALRSFKESNRLLEKMKLNGKDEKKENVYCIDHNMYNHNSYSSNILDYIHDSTNQNFEINPYILKFLQKFPIKTEKIERHLEKLIENFNLNLDNKVEEDNSNNDLTYSIEKGRRIISSTVYMELMKNSIKYGNTLNTESDENDFKKKMILKFINENQNELLFMKGSEEYDSILKDIEEYNRNNSDISK